MQAPTDPSIRLRKHLSVDDATPTWPPGIQPMPVSAADPAALHTLLVTAYTNGFGTVAPREQWWPAITADDEYEPELVFVAADPSGTCIGFALCWNSGFIKDIAVDAAWRGRGLGEALLRTAFSTFRHRGLSHVDLKVMPANTPAIRLYHRLRMEEV